MNVMLTQVSAAMHPMAYDPPTIVFAWFFREKHLPAMNKYIMVAKYLLARVVCSESI